MIKKYIRTHFYFQAYVLNHKISVGISVLKKTYLAMGFVINKDIGNVMVNAMIIMNLAMGFVLQTSVYVMADVILRQCFSAMVPWASSKGSARYFNSIAYVFLCFYH
jgi:hypothetical protein